MATKKDKSPKEEFKKKAPKAKKPKAKTSKKEKEQPYTGGINWCGTMNRNRRFPGGRSGESW